jgi:hypothetical protein
MLNGGLVVPAHASLASDSVFFMSSGGQVGCNNTAALDLAWWWSFPCGGVRPSAPLSVVGFTPMISILACV